MKNLFFFWSVLLLFSCNEKAKEQQTQPAIIAKEQTVEQKQNAEYAKCVRQADSLYKNKKYKESAAAYSNAFKSIGWKGQLYDRYNAACSWALAGVPDSAFFNLERIVTLMEYIDYDHITTDTDLTSLHDDKRWQPLIDLIKANKTKAEANYNIPLMRQLESIYKEDQKYRMMIDSVDKTYGSSSKQMNALWGVINEKDAMNLLLVKQILNEHGWVGKDVVGEKGNSALFLVIQHADIGTQEKYLPMMKEAVKKGKANASSLALLIDRIEVRNNRPQIYGSQLVQRDGKTTLYPIIDSINVNKRRAEVGLEPLEDYLNRFITYEPVDKFGKK